MKLTIILPLALVLLTVLPGIGMAQDGGSLSSLLVNTTGDNPVSQCDSFLSLREAILIAKGGNALGRPLTTGERNQISGATFALSPPPLGCPFGDYWSITGGVGQGITDTINFTNNVGTIFLTSGLPNVTWAEDIINGLKGDGSKAAIDGTIAGSVPGLRVTATVGFTIRNLIIQNFQYEGILVEGSSNGHYEGLEIHNNGRDGILFIHFSDISSTFNSKSNTVGGTSASQRNYIYSNGFAGIAIIAAPFSDRGGLQNNVIENNYIGLNPSGNADFGNGYDGIYLENAWGNRIGGDTSTSRNVISGNNGNGILVVYDGSFQNVIFNNFVGTNAAGNAVIGNTQTGIAFALGAGYGSTGTKANKVGDVGKGNVIGGNFFGVGIFDANTSNVVIRGNSIGIDQPLIFSLGNVRDGVYINNAFDNTIGGCAVGEGNIIANNGGAGVYVEAGVHNAVRCNGIFQNSALGIDLHPGGVTLNDFNDGDTGPNNLQNYPLISGASSSSGFTNLVGSINTTANTTLNLDFFVTRERDPSGYGEGRQYIGSALVTTNNVGDAGFNRILGTTDYSGYYATVTATDASGNTSEFSPAFRIPCGYNLSSSSQNVGMAGGTGSFNVSTPSACDWQAIPSANWITITGGASGSGNGTVSFSVAANSGAPRTGTITVGGQTFTVNQSGCTYSLVSNTAGYPASGGNDGNSIIAPAGCTWTAVSNVSWVTITSGGSSSGTASFTYSVAPNTGPARQGTLTVAGLTYTINQASGCTYQLSHPSAGYPASGTNGDGASVIAGNGCTWTATSNANWITITSGSSGSGNGAVIWSVAANTGAARQGTLTIAGLTFTINQQAAAAPRRAPFDFDGDGKTDISVFRPSDGSWWYLRSSSNDFRVYTFGVSTDILTPGDWTGDGKTDISVFRPSTGIWFVQRSEDNSYFSFPFGINGDIPVPADYDADGKTDAAVFRPSNNTWYISNSGGSGTSIITFGAAGDKPVVADFDGDGKADIAVFRSSDGSWWYLRSSDGQFRVYRFGLSTDKPVQGDYTGDGKADIAVWRPSTGEWFIQRSEDNSFYSVPFGTNGDIPVPGDYDGDGKFDTAVFRPSDTNWYVSRSSGGTTIQAFGNSSDKPLPAAFIP